MAFPLDSGTIAKTLHCRQPNVEENWPLIERALNSQGIESDNACIAALATIGVECPPFKPIREYGSEEYLKAKRYYPFVGRGFVQITWESNYKHYGDLLGVDLVSDPDKALEPYTSAAIFALFFKEHKLGELADKHEWSKVRQIVNGGLNGWHEFNGYVIALSEAIDKL